MRIGGYDRCNQLLLKVKCLLKTNRMDEAKAVSGQLLELAGRIFDADANQMKEIREVTKNL